ncbi:hypothetical protein WOLCODRAFT_151655 [Wolfiporia cocos MD-104 SS10]|uniref:Uncharacterized protein n=1 Tax=Wolfiporia cocos (strain MD-104) TaxID=742152 RepID=A0A2H3JNX0_WOLCO|nr:hypothetical protein WOLCODRAFT_151655 [Wolfiporia cocos MD-104 SS10]
MLSTARSPSNLYEFEDLGYALAARYETHHNSTHTGPLGSLWLGSPARSVLKLAAWTEAYSVDVLDQPSLLEAPSFEVSLESSNEEEDSFMATLSSTLPLGNVSVMYVSRGVDMDAESWTSLFKSAHSIKALCVCDDFRGNLPDVLMDCNLCQTSTDGESGDADHHHTPRFCPSLRELTLKDTRFHHPFVWDTVHPQQQWRHEIVAVAKLCKLNICLHNCSNVFPGEIRRMRIDGLEVEWDREAAMNP